MSQEVLCRFCDRMVPGTDDTSRNWLCPQCRRFDARQCLNCGTRDGFPRPAETVSADQAAMSPLVTPTHGADRVMNKSVVYCARCFHNAYFVTTENDVSTCLLCRSSWDRFGPARHSLVT